MLVFIEVAGAATTLPVAELCVGVPVFWSVGVVGMDMTIRIVQQWDKRDISGMRGSGGNVRPDDGVDVPSQSTAERIADLLYRRITEGELRPGTQLSEERLGAQLGVSRNTLREAFQTLVHDGLLVHRRHRGVFVHELDDDDLVDLYRLRRTIECGVVRSLTGLDAGRLRPLRVEVEAAESAASRGEWNGVATANMRFHQCLVGLSGSRRIQDITRRMLAELRLVFHVVANPRSLHERYIRRNRALLDLLEKGDVTRAADELEQYLHDSEEALLAAYRGRARQPSAPPDAGGGDQVAPMQVDFRVAPAHPPTELADFPELHATPTPGEPP